jgi:chorismate dehydratase
MISDKHGWIIPFVFAAWVSSKELPANFLNALNQAFARGLEELPQLMYLLPSPTPGFNLQEYYTKNISYHLDAPKRTALDMFLRILKAKKLATVDL